MKSWFTPFSPFGFLLKEDQWGKTHIETDLDVNIGGGNSKTAVLTYIQENFEVGKWFSLSQFELSEINANLSERQVRRYLSNLAATGFLKKRGETRNTEYSLIKK